MNSRIKAAAELLRSGGLVAFPTETVYGVGANALDADAVARIFEAKRRPQTSPLIVHVKDRAMARELALEWPDNAERLAMKFWPGPLTIIVPKRALIADIVTAGLPSVGLRIPAHPVALALLRTADIPVAAPSANLFTELSPTSAAHIPTGLCDMVLDGGDCRVGIESTVVSLVGPVPRILRAGMITQPQIEAVIGPVETGAGAESPGQHPKHYSPRTRLVLGAPPKEGTGISPVMPAEPAAYAERLYRMLHETDTKGYDWIALEAPPDTPEWAGIRDRLKRAAVDNLEH